MNSMPHKGNNQLSLTLELPEQSVIAIRLTASAEPWEVAGVIAFPAQKTQESSFRERVIQDLMRNRVVVN